MISRTPCRRINKNLVEIIRFKKKKKIQKRLASCEKEERRKKKEKTEYPSTDTARSLMHQSFRLFALSRAISPRDLSIPPTCLPPFPPPFFLPFDTCTPARHCRLLHIAVSVRYPFPEYFAPSTHTPSAPLRGALYGGILPRRCIRYVQKCLASA